MALMYNIVWIFSKPKNSEINKKKAMKIVKETNMCFIIKL